MNEQQEQGGLTRRRRILLGLAIVLAGVAMVVVLTWTAPSPQTREPEQQARLVTVETVKRADRSPDIEAFGEVNPEREVALQPRVSGSVLETTAALEPGNLVDDNELLLRIDPADFALAVEQRKAELEQARAELQLEEGNQVVARQEYEMLDERVSEEEKALMLRQPQMKRALARVSTAQAALEQARLNLQRTRLRAPFDAVVLAREVTRGAQVSSATTVARLAGTEAYRLELSVPVSQLPWINLPRRDGEASSVEIFHDGAWTPGASRSGRVLRVRGDLGETGRMARVLVRVPDPLARSEANAGKPRLLLDSFVRASIQGRTLENVIAIDRAWLRSDNQVWVMNAEDELRMRDVEVVLRSAGTVYIRDGLQEGERVVTSSIEVVAEGMPLRLNAEDEAGDKPDDGEPDA
jgi:RND family efflux transporter MFP subunit